MIIDNNLIAYEYYKNQFVPKEVYPSGERDETKLIDKYSFNNQNLPILVLEQDIVNKDGYGLKKGFYNIFHDKYLDFLLEETEKLDDIYKGVNEFLISMMYKNKGDDTLSQKYNELSKKHMKLLDKHITDNTK